MKTTIIKLLATVGHAAKMTNKVKAEKYDALITEYINSENAVKTVDAFLLYVRSTVENAGLWPKNESGKKAGEYMGMNSGSKVSITVAGFTACRTYIMNWYDDSLVKLEVSKSKAKENENATDENATDENATDENAIVELTVDTCIEFLASQVVDSTKEKALHKAIAALRGIFAV